MVIVQIYESATSKADQSDQVLYKNVLIPFNGDLITGDLFTIAPVNLQRWVCIYSGSPLYMYLNGGSPIADFYSSCTPYMSKRA